MALRREATAPQSEVDALVRRIESVRRRIARLNQPGRRNVPVLDYEKQFDPAIGEFNIHHPGTHMPATTDANLVYYHDGEWKMPPPVGPWPVARITGDVQIDPNTDVNLGAEDTGATYSEAFDDLDYLQFGEDEDGIQVKAGLYLINSFCRYVPTGGVVGGAKRHWVTTDPDGSTKNPYLFMDWGREGIISFDAEHLNFSAIQNVAIDQVAPFYYRPWAHQLTAFVRRFIYSFTIWRISDAHPDDT